LSCSTMVFMQVISAVDSLGESFDSLARILQILGGIAGVYLILWIIGTILNLRRTKLLKEVINKLDENNKKLDKLLGSGKKKRN